MTIKDEILEELRKRTPLAEIKRKFRSQSQLYGAIREFLDEAEKTVEEGQERLVRAQEGLLKTQTELQRVNREKKEVSREIEELRPEKEKLSGEVRSRTEELNHLKAEVSELQGKGFTPEILNEIKKIEGRSGPELLSQVETVEKYKIIEREVSSLGNKKASLEEKVGTLEAKKRKIEEKLVSEKNRLDELRLRTATFREAVATMSSFFRDGYSTEDIKSLKNGLDMLGIGGDPLLSISRLVNGLKKQKNLLALEDRVVEVKKGLAMLRKNLANAKMELKVAKQVTLKAVEEARNASLEAIAKTAEHTNNAMKGTVANFEASAMESLGKIDAHIQKTMEGLRAELGEWGELQQKKGKLEELINPSLVLLGILRSNDYLEKIPLPLVAQIVDRLRLWSAMNLPDVTINPSENIHKKDYFLETWHSYKVPVLIEFLGEGLRQVMIERST